MYHAAPIAWPFSFVPEPGNETLLMVGDTNYLGGEDAASAFAQFQATIDAAGGIVVQMEGIITTPSCNPDDQAIPLKPWWRHSEIHVAEGMRMAG